MQDKVFITGACGMMGSHMIDYYHAKGQIVYGTFYKPTTNLSEYAHKAVLEECDVRYYGPLHNLISRVKPSIIFHLAGQSYPTVSMLRPQETMETNVHGTINVFESVIELRRQDPDYDPLIIVACSSAEYGSSLVPDRIPVKEDTPLLPLHPYGVSKVAQELIAYQYFMREGIRTIRVRIFNTTGPRKVNDVISDFTKRAVLVEQGIEKKFRVGNLEAKRAITDVRDLIRAMFLLTEKGKAGEVYNASGSKVYQVSELLQMIEKMMNLKLDVQVDKELLRIADEPLIHGDSTRLITDTGWKQEYTIEQTLSDMIAYWRATL